MFDQLYTCGLALFGALIGLTISVAVQAFIHRIKN